MSEMSRLALATLLQVEERCDSLGWGYILAYDEGEAEALVYLAGADKPTFKGTGKNSCEALERLAENIVDADLRYSERVSDTEKVIHDSKTEETNSPNQEPSAGTDKDENHVG
jgi:hypothetical protein